MGLRDRLVDPKSPDRRPRRAAYALPTLFTAGNIFLGYLSILASFRGAMLAASHGAGAADQFAIAAKAIGAAVFLASPDADYVVAQTLNVDGGAISLGHPVGCSGNRIVLHLVNAMKRLGTKRGIATECIGGGQGGAMLIETV